MADEEIHAKLIVPDTGPLITLAAADSLDYLRYPGALMQDIGKLGSIVEVDETFLGGLAKNKHKDKQGGGKGTRGIGSGNTKLRKS